MPPGVILSPVSFGDDDNFRVTRRVWVCHQIPHHAQSMVKQGHDGGIFNAVNRTINGDAPAFCFGCCVSSTAQQYRCVAKQLSCCDSITKKYDTIVHVWVWQEEARTES